MTHQNFATRPMQNVFFTRQFKLVAENTFQQKKRWWMHHSSYNQLFEDMHGLPKPSNPGLRTSDIFEQKGNEKQTLTYPLVLSSWQVVVLTSSLENNRKNWTTIVGFVFLAIFSWFFHPQKWEVCFEHIFDFRNYLDIFMKNWVLSDFSAFF